MVFRSDKLNTATDSKGNVKVLLTHKRMDYGENHVFVVGLNLSAKFMKWFMQEYVNACPHTDVTVHIEDRRYLVQTEHWIAYNVLVPRMHLGKDGMGQKRWPGLPGFYEVRKVTGFTEIKDYAMPNLRTEWMKLHS